MKDLVSKAGGIAVMTIFAMGCGGGGQAAKEASPLTDGLELRYSETATYKDRTMNKEIQIVFTAADDGKFKASKTTTDQNGSYTDDLMVNEEFLYNDAMDYNVGGYHIWLPPAKLATGQIGRLKVEERTYNGKEVYAALWTDKSVSYYDKETGLQEGSETQLSNGSQIITRTN